ncbi:MAG: hypothetical protein C4548_00315 [Desulfobacteraceae bacterium]|nr:MAG: hypothetical protein C4548_00315 [Desulfobacteraceae bacterium]
MPFSLCLTNIITNDGSARKVIRKIRPGVRPGERNTRDIPAMKNPDTGVGRRYFQLVWKYHNKKGPETST